MVNALRSIKVGDNKHKDCIVVTATDRPIQLYMVGSDGRDKIFTSLCISKDILLIQSHVSCASPPAPLMDFDSSTIQAQILSGVICGHKERMQRMVRC